MSSRTPRINGFQGFYTTLGRAVLARHRCQPDGLCSCGMDREACPVARPVRMLLRRYPGRPLLLPAHVRRVAEASLTGPGRVSPLVAAHPGAPEHVDQERAR